MTSKWTFTLCFLLGGCTAGAFEEDPGSRERATNRARVTDAIRKKLGDGAILRGRLLEGRERK